MRSVLDEMARRRGYTSSSDYQGSLAFNGAAPSRNSYFDTKEEHKAAFEDGSFEGDYSLGDFVDNSLDGNDLGWQIENPHTASHGDKATMESLENLRSVVKGKKRTIKMYRAVDALVKEGSFCNGNFFHFIPEGNGKSYFSSRNSENIYQWIKNGEVWGI